MFRLKMERSYYEELLVVLLALRRQRRKRKRRYWVCPIFTLRKQQGEYHNLLQEMRLLDPESHFRYLRMSRDRFDCLLAKVSYLVFRKQDRKVIYIYIIIYY